MSYIGSSAAPQFLSFSGVRSQSFNGDGTTTAFNLNRPVDNVTSIEVLVNNVQQSPFDSSYSVSGSTLTFSEAPSSGTGNVYVIFRDAPLGSLNPLDGSVTTAKLANGAVTNAKLAADGFDAGKFTTGTLPIARVADGAVTAAKLASTLDLTGKTVTLPAGVGGKVLQVVQTVKSDTSSTTSTSFIDVTGLSVSITPSAASSKILVLASVSVGTPNTNFVYINLLRGSTALCIGDTSSGRISVTGMSFAGVSNEGNITILPITFLDSPNSTSSLTYKIQFRCTTTGNAYINRSHRDQTSAGSEFDMRLASTITVMEIAA